MQQETPISGRPVNLPGLYRHEASGTELIILPDAQSTAQQDAVVRMGFVRIADAPTRPQLLAMQEAQAKKDKKAEKAGEVPEPYEVPGTQEVVYNGSATDTNGPGDALAVKDAEIARLQAALEAAQAEPEVSANVETQVPTEPVAPAPGDQTPKEEEPVAEEAPAPEVPAEPAPAEETPAEAPAADAPAEPTPEAPAEEVVPAENQTNEKGK